MSKDWRCAGCGAGVGPVMKMNTVNLTPDLLMIGGDVYHFETLFEGGVAWDWCDVECFVKWLTRAVVHMQAVTRS